MRGLSPRVPGEPPTGTTRLTGKTVLSRAAQVRAGRLQSCSIRAVSLGGWEDSKSLPPQKRGLELWIPAFAGKTGWGRFHHVERLCNLPAGQGGCATNLFRRLQNVLVIQFLPGLFQEVLAYFLVPLGR